MFDWVLKTPPVLGVLEYFITAVIPCTRCTAQKMKFSIKDFFSECD